MRCAACLLMLALATPATATAQGLDGNYVGEIKCQILTAQTRAPLSTEIRLTIAGGSVRYERNVLTLDGTQASGVKETGTGTVSPPSISMTGSAKGSNSSAEATYQGTINAGGISMSGNQKWRINGGEQNRACTITAKRQ